MQGMPTRSRVIPIFRCLKNPGYTDVLFQVDDYEDNYPRVIECSQYNKKKPGNQGEAI